MRFIILPASLDGSSLELSSRLALIESESNILLANALDKLPIVILFSGDISFLLCKLSVF